MPIAGQAPPVPMRKPVRRFVLHNIMPPIARRGYSALAESWHYEVENGATLARLIAAGQPVVGAFLHSRTFALLHFFSLPEQGRWILMCSQSRDGELMTRIEEGLGFRVARGSSGKGGARALVEMIRAQREDRGLNSCLSADGSRGPRGIAQLGTITLAQKTDSLLLPVAASADRAWVWKKSWDRTIVPKPGATVRVRMGEPIEVPAKLSPEATEALRVRLEAALLGMHADLDRITGFRDTEPLRAPDPAGAAAGDSPAPSQPADSPAGGGRPAP
ncbi:MAG: lysophospholipid acyltransferase family protein [Steroidobacteraceae bacterium]|nr:lysophospholipid acyltransferase family protein [Steroidobacteraceae bacterium]